MPTSAGYDRLRRYFATKSSRQGWVARRLVGEVDPGDATLREHLLAAIHGTLRPDGSVGGNALATIGAIHDLLALDAPEPLTIAPLGWMMALQNEPGTFADGCSAARHAHRVCEHFLGGFFSPAPPTQRVAPATLPNGKTYRIESHARFGISCHALAAALVGDRGSGPAVARHLDSFSHLLDEWHKPGDLLPLDLAFAALAAVAVAPPRWGSLLDGLVELARQQQLPDGTWQRADFFNALAGLVVVPGPSADLVLRRAVPALLQRQRDDGSFGALAQDERALIGLAMLKRVIS